MAAAKAMATTIARGGGKNVSDRGCLDNDGGSLNDGGGSLPLQTKNTGNLPVHSSVQGGYRSHPEWSLPVTSWYTYVPEGYRSLPVNYWKFET